MNLIYMFSGVTRGAPYSYFTSNVKILNLYRQDIHPYIGKSYVLCLLLCIHHKFGYESHLHSMGGVTRGVPCYYFTSNIKNFPYTV